jgi:hypothetical protein
MTAGPRPVCRAHTNPQAASQSWLAVLSLALDVIGPGSTLSPPKLILLSRLYPATSLYFSQCWWWLCGTYLFHSLSCSTCPPCPKSLQWKWGLYPLCLISSLLLPCWIASFFCWLTRTCADQHEQIGLGAVGRTGPKAGSCTKEWDPQTGSPPLPHSCIEKGARSDSCKASWIRGPKSKVPLGCGLSWWTFSRLN